MIRPISSNSNLAATQQKADAELAESTFNQVLDKARRADDEKRLKESCQEMESVFLNQVLSVMRSTVPANPLLGRSQAEEIFQSMLDQELTKSAAKTGTIGLAEILFKQLKQTLDQQPKTSSEVNSSVDTTNNLDQTK